MTNNDDQSIGYLMSDAARLMRTVFDRRVHRLGLTRAQWLVLTRLHRRPGASQSELADMMEVEKASAGRLIDRLERKGWVIRKADPHDRRVKRLYLTPEAEKIRKRMWAVAGQTVDDAICDLTTEQAQLLTDLLKTVKARVTVMATAGEGSPRTSGLRRKKVSSNDRGKVRGNGADATRVVVRGSET